MIKLQSKNIQFPGEPSCVTDSMIKLQSKNILKLWLYTSISYKMPDTTIQKYLETFNRRKQIKWRTNKQEKVQHTRREK